MCQDNLYIENTILYTSRLNINMHSRAVFKVVCIDLNLVADSTADENLVFLSHLF